MSQSPLSINVKPWSTQDWPKCLEFLRDLDPTTVVAGVDQDDHFNRILEVKALLKNAVIVARFIDKVHDGKMHLKPETTNDHYIVSPRNQLNRIKPYGQNGLIAYFHNEPSGEVPYEDKKRLVAHTIEAMTLAASPEYDMRLCVLNWGVGHPLIDADGCLDHVFDDLLMHLHAHRDRHYYGMHCYAPADFIGRLNALKNSCDKLGIPMPKVIITEFGYDAHAGSKESGFKSRGMPPEEYVKFGVDAINGPYAEWIESGVVIGLATFIYGDFPSWPSFDIETAQKGEVSTAWRDGILKAKKDNKLDIRRLTGTAPIIVPPAEIGQVYIVSTPGFLLNGRSGHDLTAAVMGSIPDQSRVAFLDQFIDGVGLTWRKVKYNQLTMWIPMKGGVKMTLYTEPPIIIPKPPVYIKPFNNAQMTYLEAWRERVKAELAMVESLIEVQTKAALIPTQDKTLG
jgi:hypothetical protein